MYITPEFTELEKRIIDEIIALEKEKYGVVHFPIEMTDIQIVQAIKEAYESAEKAGYRTHQVRLDKLHGEVKCPEEGSILYKGRAKNGLDIYFYYDLKKQQIETAYPVLKKSKNKKK